MIKLFCIFFTLVFYLFSLLVCKQYTIYSATLSEKYYQTMQIYRYFPSVQYLKLTSIPKLLFKDFFFSFYIYFMKVSHFIFFSLLFWAIYSETIQLFSASTFLNSPSPILTGSLRGGRTIYIKGIGFPNNPTLLQVSVGPFTCKIPADGVTPTILSCETTDTISDSDVKSLLISVMNQGQIYTLPSTVFNYLQSQTPMLSFAHPIASVGGSRLSLFGIHRILNAGDGLRDMGDFLGLYVGDSICSMFDINQDYISYSTFGKIDCQKSKLQTAGKYNISEHVLAGWSKKLPTMRKASFQNLYYEHTVLPSIQDMKPNIGFKTGQNIQIQGSGFSNNPKDIQIKIDGVNCDILSSTITDVKCRLRQKTISDSSLLATNSSAQINGYINGAGFNYARYNISLLPSASISTFRAAVSTGLNITLLEAYKKMELQTKDIFGQYYGQVFKGYFYAPVGGRYIFRGSADDQFVLLINPNYGTTEGQLNEVISSSSPCFSADNYYLSNITSTFGSPMIFQEGKYYYMQIYHINLDQNGFLKISVQVPNNYNALSKQTFQVNHFETSFTNDPQIITFTLDGATSGTFNLSITRINNLTLQTIYSKQVTIIHNATASQFASALNQFDSYSPYLTTCISAVAYDNSGNVVTLSSPSKKKVIWTLQIQKLRPADITIERFKFKGNNLANFTGINSTFVQVITNNHSSLIGGTFTMDLGGQSIKLYDNISSSFSIYNLPFDVGSTTLQLAVRQIAGFENVQVFRYGDPNYGSKWVISYNQYFADVPDLVLSGSRLIGGGGSGPKISFYQTRKWSSDILFNPVDQNFLFSPAASPNLIIKVNNISGVCLLSDCSYTFRATSPQVTLQAIDSRGITVSISISDPTNSNFLLSNTKVSVDNKLCVSLAGTFNSFSCQLPSNSDGSPQIRAGLYNAQIFIEGYGYIPVRNGIQRLSYDLKLNSLSFNSGGQNGGYQLQIQGSGFPENSNDVQITLCGKKAIIVQISAVKTRIIVPSCVNTGSMNLNYTYNGISKVIPYSYTFQTVSSRIISINPMISSPVKKGVLSILGSSFGVNSSVFTAYLVNEDKIYQLKVLEVNETIIKCGLSGGLAGNYKLKLVDNNLGEVPFINVSDNNFSYKLSINSISPLRGSFYGGTLITISGSIFSADLNQNLVSMSIDSFCKIQSGNETSIQCRTPAINIYSSTYTYTMKAINRLIATSDCPNNNCNFTYQTLQNSPKLTQLSNDTIVSATGFIVLTGVNLNLTNQQNVKVILENKISGQIFTYPAVFINLTAINFTLPNLQGGIYYIRVRLDPLGQSNSLNLNFNASLTSLTRILASVKGGKLIMTGTGFPSKWPTNLWTLSINMNTIPIEVEVTSTNVTQMEIKIPQGVNGTIYTCTLTSPFNQIISVRYVQVTDNTPNIDIISNLTVASGLQTIKLNRTNLNSKPASSIQVFNILNKNRFESVTSWSYNRSIITFSFNFSAGLYSFRLWFPDYGWANVSKSIQVSALTNYSASNRNSSFLGGIFVIIGSDISRDAIIKVGGFKGTVISKNSSSATFSIPSIITPNIVAQYPGIANQAKITPESIINDVGGNNSVGVFDSLQKTFYSSPNPTCFVGLDVGQNKVANIKRIRYFPNYNWDVAVTYLKGAVFEGSNNNINFYEIGKIGPTAHAGWNSIIVNTTTNYRYIRMKHNNISQCQLAQIEVYGIVFNNIVVSNVQDFITDVIFYDGFNSFNFSGAVRFLKSLTPNITSVSPNYGTIYGGTILTFVGLYLNAEIPNVIIDGVQCVVDLSSINETYFSCTTGPRLTIPSGNTFQVKFGNYIPRVDGQFLYVNRWSDPKSWGTDLPPVQGDLIYVPKGMSLLVDQSTPRLDGIIVEEGKIIFSDEVDMQIHTNLITVNRGQFRAGTQLKPYKKKLTFIMYGNYTSKQQPMFGNKGIGCMECKFSLYGTPRIRTWSILASTINAGSTTLTVLQNVDWKIGEEIVVASTDFDHNQAEQRTITNIVGRQITVNQSFEFRHFGEIQTYGNDRVDMRAQVGLLTRNIKIMGDPTSQSGEYGSHLMMSGKSQNGMTSHIAYTQFTKCGQPKIVGRYCIHFHMNGDVINSKAIGNSVHHSFARVITIHGVQFLHVSQNVGYRVKGHNFFVEDGIQTQNLIENNLAIGSLQTSNMLQTDISVASFWITNPTNHVRGNRAAGGDFYGFWYEIKPNPDGPSATSDVCPIGNPLGQSHDNVAHSYKRFGLRIFKLSSREKPCIRYRDETQSDPWSTNPSIQSLFYNYIMYKNGQAGVLAEQIGNAIFENFTIAESKISGMQFFRTNLTKEYVEAKNIVIVGLTNSNQPFNLTELNGARGIIAPRTNGWKMENVRFYNFPQSTIVFQTCSQCQNKVVFTNSAQEYFVKNITFSNINGSYLFMKGLKREIIFDVDGSFSINFNNRTRSSATLVSNFKHIAEQIGCTMAEHPSLWDNALACDQTITIRRAMFTNLLDNMTFSGVPMKAQKIANELQIVSTNSTSFTQIFSFFEKMEPIRDKRFGYALPFVTNRIYNIWWLTGLDFTHLALDVSQNFLDTDAAIIFKFNYTQERDKYEIGHYFNNQVNLPLISTTNAGSLDRSTCRFGDYIHDKQNNILTICATSRGKIRPFEYLDVNSVKCGTFCPEQGGQFVKQNFTRLWSNISHWPGGRLPSSGQNVTIPGEWTIFVDIMPAQMNFLLIDGDMIIQNNLTELNITAKSIWIRGGSLRAGSINEPFQGKMTILIIGNKEDRGFTINDNIAGNKLFVIHGKLLLYGKIPENTWLRLGQTIRPGASSMVLTSSLNGWRVGDRIAIGPSFSLATQHQLFTITSINNLTNQITFFPSANFTHFGSNQITVNNSIGTLDTRAAVGLISRNIKITNGMNQGWGFQTIIHGYNDGTRIRSGSVFIQGVQFAEGGQYDTQNTPLKIWNTAVSSNLIQVRESSFYNCKTYCLDVLNINNANVSNNIFYYARVLHVRALQLRQFQFSSNLMISVNSRPTIDIDLQLIACYLTYDSIHNRSINIKNNLCQGSAYHGFAIPFVPCNYLNQMPYSNNTVGSAWIGYILNKIPEDFCMASSGLKAYACEIAQITNPPDTEKLVLKNFMIADSKRAVTLRFGKQGDDRTAYLSDSYISAISRPDCSQCYGQNATDCTNNYAIRMLAVTVNGEAMPSKYGKIFDTLCRNQVYDSKAFLSNVIFENYNLLYPNLPQCMSNVIFKNHPGATDMTGSHHLQNVFCNNCSFEAMAIFTPPNPIFLGWMGGCGDMLCTGANNYLIHDHTGNLFGQPSILLANNSQIGNKTQNCRYIPQINGHHCLREDLAVLEYQNIAPDYRTRIMWPAYLKYDGGLWNTSTNGYKQWDWQGSQPQNHRLGRFISVIQLNKTYNLTFQSEPPTDMRIQIQQRTTNGNPNDWIIVKMIYPRANSIRIQNRADVINPITLLDNNTQSTLNTSLCGSNKFFYQNRTIHFVVTGDKMCQVRVTLTNSIMLSTKIDLPMSTFISRNGRSKFIDSMCSVLGITDTSRLKVVSIYNGSVQITAYIQQSRTTTIDNSTSSNNAANAQEVTQLQNLISVLYQNGTLQSSLISVGLGSILSFQTQVFYHDPPSQQSNQNQDKDEKQLVQIRSSTAMVIGIVIGSTLVFVAVIAVVIYFLRKRRQIAQVIQLQPSQVHKFSANEQNYNESTFNFEMRKLNEK